MTKHLPSILVQFALFLGAALALTCTEPESVECPSGRVCPVGTVCAAAQDVCIANGCGDSVQDTGEVCDDGNVRDGDGCSADCESIEECGNDIVDSAAGEVCDDDNTEDGDGCSADCKSSELCGNDIVDEAAGEVCDDGNTDSEDGCRNDCISDETCGNGETDTAVGEACDDGNTVDGDACSSDCSSGEGCGNGFVNVGEICDDGNQVDDDGCSANCLSDETCGNDIVDFAAGEVCDGGNDDSGDGCRSDCKSDETCGNDELDADPGVDPVPEQCDDGGTVDGNGCSALCQLEVCGNDVLDDEFGETCDDGNTSDGPCVDDPSNPACDDDCSVTACPTGFFCSDITGLCNGLDTCSSDCRSGQGCGDGNRDITEECDDGNTDYEDDCIVGATGESIRCEIARCGDGWTDTLGPDTEDCDGDNAGVGGQTEECNIDCTAAVCGDGVVNQDHIGEVSGVVEQCDDDGQSAFCNDDCTIAVCGDGIFNDDTIEECDTGGNSATCNADCTDTPVCGDGRFNPMVDPPGPLTAEQCDDAGTVSGDGCSATCEVEPFTLTISRSGSGEGKVTTPVGPPTIDCGPVDAQCTEQYVSGASVTLTATPGTDSAFTGWSGGCTGTTNPCVVSMTASKSVVAIFDDNTLTVVKAGAGTGTIASVPAGDIACGGDCTDDYNNNTVVTLSHAASANSVFAGWSGGGATCNAVTATCVTTMTGAKTVTATFGLNPITLTVVRGGNAASTGSVTSVPSGITCNGVGACNAPFPQDSSVVLSASPAANASFTGWSGTGITCPGTGPCTVTMDIAKTVTADFVLDTHLLSVSKAGTGTGTVVADSGAVNCGATCTGGYNAGTSVILTATPTAGTSTFTGWTVPVGVTCADTGPGVSTCTVSMTQARAVTANFAIINRTLTVVRGGTPGTSGVTSSPAGISCDGSGSSDCTEPYAHGTMVGLFAAPAAGFTFTNWTGAGGGCTTNPVCFTTLIATTTVTANFAQQSFNLTAVKTGAGSGTVSADSGALNCGATCTASYLSNTVVTLSAGVSTGSTFVGWSGDCTVVGATCVATMTAAKTVTANFSLNPQTLTVVRGGTPGTSSVTASPAGIVCDGSGTSDCTEPYPHGTMVGLFAAPAAGFTFSSWTGAPGCTTNPNCFVTVTAATTVTANFAQQSFNLTVVKTGVGSGTVSADSGALSCGATCTASYLSNTVVTLSQIAATGSTFAGWSGDCTVVGATCVATMTAVKTVTANYTLIPQTLTVVRGGTPGTSAVTSSPTGISCDGGGSSDCAEPYPHGTMVGLFAAPAAGFTFSSWSGAVGCSTNPICFVTLTAATTVTAAFAQQSFNLTTFTNGAGSGTVVPSPVGTSCGTGCSTHVSGTVVTLTPNPTAGSAFSSWSGACTGSGACTPTMDAAKSVTATFTLIPRTLTVTRGGTTGTSAVTSSPTGIICDGSGSSDCSEIYGDGTIVGLFAAPAAGFTFTNWTGATGCNTNPLCFVTMDGTENVTATFAQQSFNLTAVKTGTGTAGGTVSANVGALICGATCTASYLSNTVVTLSASVAAGSFFAGWSGEGCSGTSTCVVTMSEAKTVSAQFDSVLTVTKAGNAGGTSTVTSTAPTAEPDISCGSTCTLPYAQDTVVTLTAAASSNATFTGWAGEGCSGTGTCVVTMNEARDITATFVHNPKTLVVTFLGAGTGAVTVPTSAGACTSDVDPDCTATYPHGTAVSLTATADALNTFVSWGGDCSGLTCDLTMNSAENVTARFEPFQTITVTASGSGVGTVSSTPAGIEADGDPCTFPGTCFYPYGATVGLTATPTGSGDTFVAWTGSCTGGSCSLGMTAPRTVDAEFAD